MRQAFAAAGLLVTVRYTQRPGDGERVARELAATHDRLFILGGDGTVMEAMTGLADANVDVPIGILPAGTGNQLARALHIPLTPRRAVWTLLRGTADTIDLGILNGHRRVGIGAGFGLDAAMIAGAQQAHKERLGVLSYLLAVTAAARHPQRFGVRATVDGVVIEREAAVAMVLNLGRVFHGAVELAPGASLIDGMLDMVIVDAHSLSDAIQFTLVEMVLRARRSDPRWTYATGRSIVLDVDRPGIPAQVDGDLFVTQRIAMDVLPAGGRFLLPSHVQRGSL